MDINKNSYKEMYNDLEELSSKRLQIDRWIKGNSKFISSYEDLMDNFDSPYTKEMVYNEFEELNFNPQLILEFKKLLKMLNNYKEPDLWMKTKNPIYIIEDENWNQIIKQAKIVKKLWNNEPNVPI